MAILSIKLDNKERCISFSPGTSVREILDSTDIRVRSSCGGIGACGSCSISVIEGKVNKPSVTEFSRLSAEKIEMGFRLACQVRPLDDLQITINDPAPQSIWKSLSKDLYVPVELEDTHVSASINNEQPYGVAVDLGTTQIRVSFWDMNQRQFLAVRSGLNPQIVFGADVLTRLVRASELQKNADEIIDMARSAIGKAILDICSREGFNAKEIGQVVIVGNTPMLTLLAKSNYTNLLLPDYWTKDIECDLKDKEELYRVWGLYKGASINIVQPLAGFVGSDLLAGIISTGLTKGPPGSLLIDFGTNSEIALWDSKTLWITSAAGGPAFEGSGISYGMPAEPGAVCRIACNTSSSEIKHEVIGGGDAKGICGSGLVDIISCLIKNGELKSNGRFSKEVDERGFPILNEKSDIVLQKKDIDIFQRAKAAIGAGTICLLEKAGMSINDLQRICVCGAFGRFLNIRNAQEIGLLPDIAAQKIKLSGNTALAGSELLLFSENRTRIINELKNQARIINMSGLPEFEVRFIDNLFLKPLQMETAMTKLSL